MIKTKNQKEVNKMKKINNPKVSKLKIAISSTGNNLESDVDSRFGRCPYFLIINIENNKIIVYSACDGLQSKDCQSGLEEVIPIQTQINEV